MGTIGDQDHLVQWPVLGGGPVAVVPVEDLPDGAMALMASPPTVSQARAVIGSVPSGTTPDSGSCGLPGGIEEVERLLLLGLVEPHHRVQAVEQPL